MIEVKARIRGRMAIGIYALYRDTLNLVNCGNLTFFDLRLDLIAWPLATFLINSVFEGGGACLVKFPGKMMSETQNKVGACLLKSQIARNTKFSADCFRVCSTRPSTSGEWEPSWRRRTIHLPPTLKTPSP